MNFKKMKLVAKMAVIIGAILTVIFAVLISVTTTLSRTAISQSIYGELDALSKSNGTQIQQIFDASSTVTKNMQSYLERAYSIAETNPSKMIVPTDPVAIAMCESAIYGKTLAPLSYDVELFITESARNSVLNSSDIVGVGAMFEPYKFASNIKDYAFYIAQNSANNPIEPFGAYETYSKEAYYQDAVVKKETVVTDPYSYNGVTMVSVASPIFSKNELQGIVMADINIDNFSKIDAKNDRYYSMFATIVDNTGTIIFDSKSKENVGSGLNAFFANSNEYDSMISSFGQGVAFREEIVRSDTGKKITMFFNPVTAGSETWWSLTAVDSADVNEAVVETVIWMLILSVAALALIIITTIMVLKSMLRPLNGVVEAAESISKGTLNIAIDIKSEDEIGLLSQVFLKMADSLREIIEDTNYLLGEMSEGNFEIRTKAEARYIGDYNTMLVSLRKINTNLSSTLSQINQSADQVSAGAEQVSNGAQALSQGATEQASSVEELSATITEISSQIKTNATSARQASEKAEEVGIEMTISNQKMQDMIEAMQDISNSSSQIGKIIKTIEDIAFQTNILALNAAVEAARAGAAGKGFAVVADEVRNLASKSAEASKNTSVLIESSLKAVENGTRIADDTAKSLSSAVNGAKTVTEIIDHISQASAEQAQSIFQVTQGVDQISNVVQTNSATAEESAAASEELSGQAQMLKGFVGRFKLQASSETQESLPKQTSKQNPPFSSTSGKY